MEAGSVIVLDPRVQVGKPFSRKYDLALRCLAIEILLLRVVQHKLGRAKLFGGELLNAQLLFGVECERVSGRHGRSVVKIGLFSKGLCGAGYPTFSRWNCERMGHGVE